MTAKKNETTENKAAKTSQLKDKVAANKIEVKKTVRGAIRTMEKKAEAARNQAEDIRESVVAHKIDDKKKVRSVKHTMEKKAEAAKNQAEDIREAVVAHKISDKKNIRKAARTVKGKVKSAGEKVQKSVSTPAKLKAVGHLAIEIQSPMGGTITTEEIAKKVPKNATNVYVRIDENKLFYVLKNGETGSVEIWK